MNDEFLIDDEYLLGEPEDDFLISMDTLLFGDNAPSSEPQHDQPPAKHLVTSTGLHPSLALANLAPKDSTNPWEPRLLLDLAVAVDPLETILDRYSLTIAHYESLMANALFRKELAIMVRDVQTNGASFRAKARVQAEGYLSVLDMLVYDMNTPSSTKLSAIQSVVRWGDLEPKPEKTEQQGPTQAINVQINF